MEDQAKLRSRFRGSLLGLAAGDALGVTLEFQPPAPSFPSATWSEEVLSS